MKLHATSSLVNALFVSAPVALLAIIAHRPDVLLLVVPLIAYVGLAIVLKPDVTQPRLTSAERPRITEGGGVPVTVQATTDRPAMMVLAWPNHTDVEFKPSVGTTIGAVGEPLIVVAGPQRWGRFIIPPATVTLNDALGAWTCRAEPVAGPAISVVPQTMTLVGPDGVRDPVGLTGAHRSSDRGDGSELADLREFRPGDRVRRINWRVTARRGVPYVTTTYLDEDTDVLILLDTTAEVPAEDTQSSTSLDRAMRATAAIARYYCGVGDRVAVHDFGVVLGQVPAGTGPRQARIVVDAISRARTDRWSVLERPNPVRRVRSGTLVFVISPLVSDEILDQIARLRQLGAELVVVDTFPDESGTAASLDRGYSDYLAEAVVLRRLQRSGVTESLQRLGVPTAAWSGPSSLGGVLLAMSAARSAPRLRGTR